MNPAATLWLSYSKQLIHLHLVKRLFTWIYFELDIILEIQRLVLLCKRYIKSGIEDNKDEFHSANITTQKVIDKKTKVYFGKKIPENSNNSKICRKSCHHYVCLSIR